MRFTGSIPDAQRASVFGDYLTSIGVGNDVEQGASGFSIWVHDDDRVEQAKQELSAYLADPAASRYAESRAQAERLRKQTRKLEERRRRNFIDVRTSWSALRAGKPVILTIVLIAASCAVALLTKFGSTLDDLQSKLYIASDPSLGLSEILHGQVWRLFSPMLLHFGAMHLLFNMFWLFDFGSAIERRKGTLFLAALVFSSELVSGLAQYFWAGPHAGGMSGVVYALFGYVWMKGKFEPQDGLGVSQQTVVLMIAWLFLCMTGWIGPIANAAHVVGLLVGMALGHAPYSWKRLRRGRMG
jgi:GlpG protein